MTMRTAAAVTKTLIGAVIVASLLAGCTADPGPNASAAGDDLLTAFGLEGLDAREVIDLLEATPVAERPEGLIASVRPDAVVLSDDSGQEQSLPLPSDAFYVSLAPYREQTHDCFFHSLTTCLGELRNEEITVRVVDRDGVVVVDEAVRTNDNGFAGFWLPRDLDATVTVEHDGRTVSLPITTGADDPTCITTLQLS